MAVERFLTEEERKVTEGTTPEIGFTLVKEDGEAIALASLDTLTLHYYDLATGEIINSRDGQDVKNANNVTVSSAGVVAWTLQPEDTAIVGGTGVVEGNYERHRAIFTWTWDSGNKVGRHYEDIEVLQLAKV